MNRKKKIPTLEQIIPNGIFQRINNLSGVTLPWSEDNALLDIDYIYRWSGYKSISPLIAHLLGEDESLSTQAYNNLAGIIWAYFGQAWTKKYEALVSSYDPLKNYDMREHEQNEIVDDSYTSSIGNDSTANNTSHDVYGYNSASATHASIDGGSISNQSSNSSDYDNTRTIDRTLIRSGNIGVTTSQQMLESELKLRAYRFFEQVYKDVDSIVALPIYDGELSDAIYTNTGGGGGGGTSVTSVNNKTGDVVLYGSDIDLTSLISTSVAQAITDLNNAKSNKPTILTGTIEAGHTQISFTHADIRDDSIIDMYFNAPDVKVTNWTQVSNTFTIYITAMASDVLLTVEVYN